jgi:hypothetical protein
VFLSKIQFYNTTKKYHKIKLKNLKIHTSTHDRAVPSGTVVYRGKPPVEAPVEDEESADAPREGVDATAANHGNDDLTRDAEMLREIMREWLV